MGNLVTKQINLFEFPKSIEKVKSDEKIILGDLHGNAIKLIHFLIASGVMTDLEGSDYEKLVKIYNKDHSKLSSEQIKNDLNDFKQIISKANVNKTALITLIGDIFCDRGKNDYFTFLILQKLQQEDTQLEIIYSNHDEGFIKNILYDKEIQVFPATSLENLNALFDDDILDRDEFKENVQKTLIPCYKLFRYSLNFSTESPTIEIQTHAPNGLASIELAANALNVDYDDKNVEALAHTLDLINKEFKKSLEANEPLPDEIHDLCTRQFLKPNQSF